LDEDRVSTMGVCCKAKVVAVQSQLSSQSQSLLHLQLPPRLQSQMQSQSQVQTQAQPQSHLQQQAQSQPQLQQQAQRDLSSDLIACIFSFLPLRDAVKIKRLCRLFPCNVIWTMAIKRDLRLKPPDPISVCYCGKFAPLASRCNLCGSMCYRNELAHVQERPFCKGRCDYAASVRLGGPISPLSDIHFCNHWNIPRGR
jgi:hypothetical protein